MCPSKGESGASSSNCAGRGVVSASLRDVKMSRAGAEAETSSGVQDRRPTSVSGQPERVSVVRLAGTDAPSSWYPT